MTAMTKGAYATYKRSKATLQDSRQHVIRGAAARVLVVYCTAYYSLMDPGRLSKGESILIHAAAGGVGQAAVQLALMIGAEIFVTVGSVEEKESIMKEYGLPADHTFYSRNASFAAAIRRATNNRGIDVVLNCLAGDLMRKKWDCLGHFGRFVKIGKQDITENARLEMAQFEHNAAFASLDLDCLGD